MNINQLETVSAQPKEDTSKEEDIQKIAKIAMHASILLNRIHTELPVTHPADCIKLLSPYPELQKLEELGNRGSQTAVEYFFNFKKAEIESYGGTPAQKLEGYRTLLATFEEIEREAKNHPIHHCQNLRLYSSQFIK